ncbi:MAG: hypothetical protein Fur0037_01370 [Planctomycetota bacterium]
MTRSVPTALALGLLASSLVSQSGIVPSAMASTEGGSGSSIPFGLGQPMRYMCIYDAEELPWTGPRLISAIAIRADNSVDNQTSFPQVQYVDLTVLVSTSTTRAEDASLVFDENHGADVTTVIPQAHIVLPAQPPMAGPRPPNIVLQFAQPWFYGLTPARGPGRAPDSLVVEIRIRSQPSGVSYRIDNLGGCSSQRTPFGNLDAASCLTSANANLTLDGDASMTGGTSYTYRLAGMAPNSLFGVMVNVTDRGTFLGQPLPVPLFDPLQPTQPNAALGLLYAAPGCWVNVQPVAVLIGTGDANGNGSASLRLPAGRRFLGLSVYAQAAVSDISANPLFFVTSLGQRATMCGPLGVARLYASGETTPSGQLSFGQGAVIEVR